MRRQPYSSLGPSSSSGNGEPLIVVEETTIAEEEAEKRTDSPLRCLDPDSPSLNPYLLSPWRDTRKHSLPTPQCTSGITASQVRRLSERGGEGPSPREAAFLATLSQSTPPQSGGRRHSVVTISRVPSTLFGRNRRESIAAYPLGGATRILPSRRDSTSGGISGPPSNSGSFHNLQLDIMDDIAEIKARKVRLKMYETPSRERVCEIQPLEGNGSSQLYTQNQKRRYSDFSSMTKPVSISPIGSTKRRASEMPRLSNQQAAGIVCSNTDLISILNSLTSSATEIDRCGRDEPKSTNEMTTEQKRACLKNFRSNSFDVSILHGTQNKQSNNCNSSKLTNSSSIMAPSTWFLKRHQPMSKKQKSEELPAAFNVKFESPKFIDSVRDSLMKGSTGVKNTIPEHKVVWDDTSGTKVDAQVLGSAIEKLLTAHKDTEQSATVSPTSSSGKPSTSPNKPKTSKVASWFSSGNNKEQEQKESCEPSICSSLKDLFVK